MTNQLFQPETTEDLRDIVNEAREQSRPLLIQGGGTKTGWGHAPVAGDRVETKKFDGIDLYEPAELVLTAKSGTPISNIEALLADHAQHLAFEPPDFRGLYGTVQSLQTLGGIVACNLSGSRRIQAGAARDHLLGFEAVSGRGELFKSGGRVVKNVTGFDLSKLMAGSFGTLAVMTSLSVKVMPVPEKTRTLLISGLDEAQAVRAMTKALQSPHEVNAAAYLAATQGRRSSVSYVSGAGQSITALRIQGPGPSVSARLEELYRLLSDAGDIEELHAHNSKKLWQEIGNVAPLLPKRTAAIWRMSLPPASSPAVAARLKTLEGAELYLDWGGGLVWFAVPDRGDADAKFVRACLEECGGHATLMRSTEKTKACVPVFQPQSTEIAALTMSLKSNFDPAGILNPGRMG